MSQTCQWRTWGIRIDAGAPSGLLGSERTLRDDVQQCRDEDGDLDAGRMPHLGDHALCRVSILSVSKILICQIGGEQ